MVSLRIKTTSQALCIHCASQTFSRYSKILAGCPKQQLRGWRISVNKWTESLSLLAPRYLRGDIFHTYSELHPWVTGLPERSASRDSPSWASAGSQAWKWVMMPLRWPRPSAQGVHFLACVKPKKDSLRAQQSLGQRRVWPEVSFQGRFLPGALQGFLLGPGSSPASASGQGGGGASLTCQPVPVTPPPGRTGPSRGHGIDRTHRDLA